LACLLAGTYGALHNQISYTVSREYFTEYKFRQFQISPSIPERTGAAVVGWRASWWMGLLLGFILLPIGLVIRGAREYFLAMTCVFGIVTLTTLLCGLFALMGAYFLVDEGFAEVSFRHHEGVENRLAFARAGVMHNGSYLGGGVGLFVGSVWIAWKRWKQSRTTP